MNKLIQEVYINLDDSGKLTTNEQISVYGGIVFFSKSEKDKFITQYRSIVNNIKCSYCDICNNKCPEIKNTNIKSSDKRRLMNYIKKYYVVSLIIKNDEVYNFIKVSKSAKGRFLDYAIRLMIKNIIKCLINKKYINPNKPIKIIINIDQQSTKSNGYYNLHDGLIEELKYGIINYDYNSTFNPVVFSELDVKVAYQDSVKSYAVQAADILAGTIRKTVIENIDYISCLNSFVDFKIILP